MSVSTTCTGDRGVGIGVAGAGVPATGTGVSAGVGIGAVGAGVPAVGIGVSAGVGIGAAGAGVPAETKYIVTSHPPASCCPSAEQRMHCIAASSTQIRNAGEP